MFYLLLFCDVVSYAQALSMANKILLKIETNNTNNSIVPAVSKNATFEKKAEILLWCTTKY